MTFKPGQSGNPNGRPRRDASAPHYAVTREDGWLNFLSGLGTAAKDKRGATTFCTQPVPYQLAQDVYRGDPLGARMVEILPDAEVRMPYDVLVASDDDSADGAGKELAEFMSDEFERLGALPKVREARCYARAYGGGAMVLGANDGQDMREPLDLERVSSFDWINVLEPREIYPVYYYGDARAPKFGQPAIYQLAPMLNGSPYEPGYSDPITQVHESRVIVFKGPTVTRMPLVGTIPGWGDSIFTRLFAVLADFNVAWSSAGILVSEFAQPIFKIEDFARMMEEGNKDLFLARMSAVAMSRATCNTVLLDKNEDFVRQTTPVTGLPDLLDRFEKYLAACLGCPLPVFFGESPGGINASGASGDQMRAWYDTVESSRMKEVCPALRRISDCAFAAAKKLPKRYSIVPRPLWQPTAKEQAETRKIVADTDAIYLDRGVTENDEVRRNRFEGDAYSPELHVEKRDPATDPTSSDEQAMIAEGGKTLPGATGPQPAQPEIQKQAMNGAQVTSLIEVVTAAAEKTISRESAKAILMLAFQVEGAEADALIGPDNFEPAKPEPPPIAPVPPGKPPEVPAVPAPKPAEPGAKPATTEAPKPGKAAE